MKNLLAIAFALTASAQSVVVIKSPVYCPTMPAVLAIAGTPARAEIVCLTIGPGVVIDLASKTINAAPAPAATLKMQVETVTLDPATPESQTTMTYTLKQQPAPGTALFALYQSSALGFNRAVAIAPPINPSLTITLPTHRPFTPEDVLTLVYWTN